MRVVTLLALVLVTGAPPKRVAAQTPEQIAEAASILGWRTIGPTIMGGRVSDLAVVESDPSTFYVGTATGGIWKTENAGITFRPVFDDEETASIGDVTLSPSNPNVVWVGTGEPQNRQSSPWGNGVYRSTDAGRTWTHLGLEDTHHISRISVHPRDPDVAYVAAVGHLWGSNAERGVYKTVDGGQSWQQVLFIDDNTGAIDLAMDPGDPQTLFAAMYQRQRKAWGFNGGGPGSGIYRTTDGGTTWTELTVGLPTGDKGRIGLDIYRQDGNQVCALVEADARSPDRGGGQDEDERQTGFYCSTDRGETWAQRSTTNSRPMYYSQVRIDPNDPERIYLGGTDLYRSSDGGRSFTPDAATEVHSDHHALWIDPANSDHLILGGDGGTSISWDRSDSWYQLRNLPLGQFYEISVDSRDPYHVCGGLQDNGSWCAPSDTWSNQGIRTRDWYNVGSGDGFFTWSHPDNPLIVYAESQGGNLTRVDLNTGERARLRPIARTGPGGEAPDLRFNWNTPVLLSSHDENTLYIGANMLFKSTDMGQNWDPISPDLTFAVDRAELAIMGVLGSEPQMSVNDGQSNYGTLTAIAESPRDSSVLYVGADDGRLSVTTDAGGTWTDITTRVEGLPANTYVTRIVASHAQPGTVFAAFDGHRSDDFAPHLYRSTDFGQNWDRIVSGLPQSSVNALAQHPDNASLLFVGNELGVYISLDSGGQWTRLENGLPTVPVDDIEIHPRENDLVVGTHGRGVWIMDDISPLEDLTPGVFASSAHAFPIRNATSYNAYSPQGWTPGVYAAPNPPSGARIRYYLATELEELALTITTPTGDVIRELEAPTDAGFNEVMWDLRLVENDADGHPMAPGPRVLPGTYLVELSVFDQVIETEVLVRLDPRVQMNRGMLMARHDAMLSSYRLTAPALAASEALERLTDQLEDVADLLQEADGVAETLVNDVASILEAVDTLAEELDDASGGGNEWNRIQSVSGPPTADQLWRIEQSWEQLPPIISRINNLVTTRMPALYGQLDDQGVRPNPGEPIPLPRRGG